MEIYLNNEKAYVKKDFSKIFIFKGGKLSDNSCNVLFWEPKDKNDKFDDVFSPVQNETNSLEEIQIQRIYDDGKKTKLITLFYDKEYVDVNKKVLYKKDKITVSGEKINFLEVFYDQKTGFALSDISYDEAKDWWMMPLIILDYGVGDYWDFLSYTYDRLDCCRAYFVDSWFYCCDCCDCFYADFYSNC